MLRAFRDSHYLSVIHIEYIGHYFRLKLVSKLRYSDFLIF